MTALLSDIVPYVGGVRPFAVTQHFPASSLACCVTRQRGR